MDAAPPPEAIIAQKTRHVAERVVLGRRATRNWAVTLYRVKQVLSAVLTFVGGLGIGTSLPGSGAGWQLWVGLGCLAAAALLEVYRVLGLEERAVQALAAAKAFALVEKKLGQALEERDPTAPLNLVAEDARALELNFYTVLAAPDEESRQEAQALADALLARTRAGWSFPGAMESPPPNVRFRQEAGEPVARFRLDADGRPASVPGPGDGTSYAIELSLLDARPEVTSVTYLLDGSYYDPMRVSDNPANAFRQEITAYGEFLMEIRAQVGAETLVRRAWLSEMLAAGHRDDRGLPELEKAIRAIEEG